jgi:hypothetical protein
MRKSSWILSLLVLFLVIDVHAETLAQCKAKCKSVSDDSCNVCCAKRDEKARNSCGLDALKKLSECRDKAKTAAADQACDDAFATRATYCHNGSTELDLKPFTCGGKAKRD